MPRAVAAASRRPNTRLENAYATPTAQGVEGSGTAREKPLNVGASLEGSTNANELYSHHQQVRNYYNMRNQLIVEAFRYVRGQHWNDDELNRFRQLNKAPIVFMGQLKSSERTVLGLFLQNRYDVKFTPVGPEDQSAADVRNALYAYTENGQDWRSKDVELLRQAWAGGMGYQEVYVEARPGQEPRICTVNLNCLALYYDAESRDLIARTDAEHCDRETWVTPEYLADAFGLSRDELRGLIQGTVTPQPNVFRDLTHDSLDKKNGRLKVVERLYKVYKKHFYVFDEQMNRVEVNAEALSQLKALGQEVYSERLEYFNLAIVCPAYNSGTYLYNDTYHCQPRNPVTKKLIWPWLEMVAESLNGDPSGFVIPQVGALKVVDSVMSSIVHAAKHGASTSYLRNKDAFDNLTAKQFDANHTNADEVFPVNAGVPLSGAVAPVPKGDAGASRDNYQALELAMAEGERASSTPPSIKGMTENASTSGILNAQRIEQAFVQLQVLIENWRHFLRQRALLCQAYWAQYFTYQKVIRIVGEDGKPQTLTLNQQVPEVDAMGQETGGVRTVNDLSVGEYDVVIDDSTRSTTYREKVQQMLAQIFTMPGVQQDPVLVGELMLEFARVSDLSQHLKDFLRQHSSVKAQEQQQKQMMEQQGRGLDNAAKAQGVAQAEAEQTAGAVPFPSGAAAAPTSGQFPFIPSQPVPA